MTNERMNFLIKCFFFLFRNQNRNRDPARYYIIGRINCVQVHCDAWCTNFAFGRMRGFRFNFQAFVGIEFVRQIIYINSKFITLIDSILLFDEKFDDRCTRQFWKWNLHRDKDKYEFCLKSKIWILYRRN